MRKLAVLSLAIALVVLVSHGPAAPALGDKPVRWEYAELKYTAVARSVAVGNPPGGRQTVREITILLSTADEEFDSKSWEELANKLKAPQPKKEGSPTLHKLRALNRLGADGWEIIEHKDTYSSTGTMVWTFKRRAP